MKVTGGPLVRAHALRPHGRLLRQSGLSVLALVAPVSAVLYWLTIPTDSWRPVFAGQVILFVICLLAAIAFFRTVIWVDRDGVSERGFLGRVTSYDKSMIGSIVLLDLYESGALDTHPQLFITGVDGRLLRQSGLSVLALVAPVSAVLYWLTIPTDSWQPVFVGQIVLVAICVLGAIAFFRTVIWVDTDGVSERGFLGRVTSYDKSEIGTIVLLDLYQSGALDTHPQLFITGLDGRLLLRMRGQFYSRGAMEMIVEQLDAPIVRVAEPMTLQDLNRSRPELLYWFERRFTSHTG